LRIGERLVDRSPSKLTFEGRDGRFETPAPDALLLACGGASWPTLGSDGRWTELFDGRDVKIAPFFPSNMGFEIPWTSRFRSEYAGMPIKSAVFSHEGRQMRGEAIVTEQGLEGGAIYAFSAQLRTSLLNGCIPRLAIDLKPDLTADMIAERLAQAGPGESTSSRLRKRVRLDPLAIALLHEHAILNNEPLTRDASVLAARVKSIILPINGMQGLKRAISTAGGLAFGEIGSDFGLSRMPGVFACGEMLDWEAPTGGYLLQACFSSARTAADGILQHLDNDQRRSQ
jgi:uncharacterized flavoprotein (TIGR03862 family)